METEKYPDALQEFIDSPAFIKQFGDWEHGEGRTPLDKSGKPMVLWHGSPKLFDAFDLSHAGENTGIVEYTDRKTGEKLVSDSDKTIFFTDNRELAISYAFLARTRILDMRTHQLTDLISLLRDPKHPSFLTHIKNIDELKSTISSLKEENNAELNEVLDLIPITEKNPISRLPEEDRMAIRQRLIEIRAWYNNAYHLNRVGGLSNRLHNLLEAKKYFPYFEENLPRLCADDLSVRNRFGDFNSYGMTFYGKDHSMHIFTTDDGKLGISGYKDNPILLSSLNESGRKDLLKTIRDNLDEVIVEYNRDAEAAGYLDSVHLYPVFLKTDKILSHDYQGSSFPDKYIPNDKYDTQYIAARQVRKALSEGYDSVAYENITDPFLATTYGVFDPKQIMMLDAQQLGLNTSARLTTIKEDTGKMAEEAIAKMVTPKVYVIDLDSVEQGVDTQNKKECHTPAIVCVPDELLHFSPIIDKLFGTESIIIYNNHRFCYYGPDAYRLSKEIMADEVAHGKAYFRGSEESGFFETAYDALETKDIIKRTCEYIIGNEEPCYLVSKDPNCPEEYKNVTTPEKKNIYIYPWSFNNCLRLSKDRETTAEELEEIAHFRDSYGFTHLIHDYILDHQNVSPKTIDYLAECGYVINDYSFIKNERTSASTLVKIAESTIDASIIFPLTRHPHFSTDAAICLAENKVANIRKRVADCSKLPPNKVLELLQDEDEEVRLTALENPNIPQDNLIKLSASENPDIRAHIARNKNLPLEIVKVLSKDTNKDVRKAISLRHDLPDEILYNLCTDCEEEVRDDALWMHKTELSTEILERLARHENIEIVDSLSKYCKYLPLNVNLVLFANNNDDIHSRAYWASHDSLTKSLQDNPEIQKLSNENYFVRVEKVAFDVENGKLNITKLHVRIGRYPDPKCYDASFNVVNNKIQVNDKTIELLPNLKIDSQDIELTTLSSMINNSEGMWNHKPYTVTDIIHSESGDITSIKMTSGEGQIGEVPVKDGKVTFGNKSFDIQTGKVTLLNLQKSHKESKAKAIPSQNRP